jgi:hypothetical protein
MPAYQQLSAVVWGIAIGIASIIVVWAVIRGAWFRKPGGVEVPESDRNPEPIQPIHDYPAGISEAHGPVPLVVRIVIVSFLVWTVVYVLMFARAGFTFS